MTWLTWRLHRTDAAIGTLLFAGLLATVFWAIRSIDAAYGTASGAGCFAAAEAGDSVSARCNELMVAYWERVANWGNLTPLLHGVPLAAALLLAIPTLMELERGTHRLAWTQSVSRRRWALGRGAFVLGVAALVGGAWATVAAQWRASAERGAGRGFGQAVFDLFPAVLLGYGLFAVALGLAAAVVIRRLVPTLAVVAVGFVGARVLTTFALRPRYRRPVEEVVETGGGFPASSPDRWVVDESFLTRTGERISWERVDRICRPAENLAASDLDGHFAQCHADNGFRYFTAYHPTDRFAQFQAIETALYLGAAAALLAFAYWWLTRRPA